MLVNTAFILKPLESLLPGELDCTTDRQTTDTQILWLIDWIGLGADSMKMILWAFPALFLSGRPYSLVIYYISYIKPKIRACWIAHRVFYWKSKSLLYVDIYWILYIWYRIWHLFMKIEKTSQILKTSWFSHYYLSGKY